MFLILILPQTGLQGRTLCGDIPKLFVSISNALYFLHYSQTHLIFIPRCHHLYSYGKPNGFLHRLQSVKILNYGTTAEVFINVKDYELRVLRLKLNFFYSDASISVVSLGATFRMMVGLNSNVTIE